MEGLARPREGQGFAWTRALTGVALLVACALTACAACAADIARAATPSASSGYSVERVCGSPRPLVAACTALRDVSAGDADAPSPAVDVTSPPPGFLTPAQLHAAYALPTGTKASAKQTVAVIDAFDDPTAEPDLGVYDEQFGLPACTAANGCFRKINQEGKASPLPPERGEWAGEISIDVQMVHAICDSCHILLVEAESEALSDLGAAVDAAVAAGATEVSNSYVSPEEPATASLYEELQKSFYEHPSVVLTAASGDCGYLNSACSEEPATANFPADVPEVVAVGGTSLREQDGAWTSAVWEDSGSGCSQIFAAPVWQRTVANFAATGCGERRSVADVAVVGDPKTGVDIYDSTPEGNGQPTGWAAFGGTSVSAPIVAAEFALAGGAQHVTHPPATLSAPAG